jgi:membrane fusion protein (multidrug efflux system)
MFLRTFPKRSAAANGSRWADRALVPHALLAAVAIFAWACGAEGEGGPGGPGGPGGDHPITVEVATVQAKPLRDVATFSGQFDAEFSVVIKPEIEGLVESIEFEEGQHVEKGALLVRLKNDTQKAILREAIANRALAQSEYDRTQQLVTRDAASAARKDQVVAELEIAKARVDKARADLDRTEIRAPFSGVVGFRTVNPGDAVDENKPIVRIDAIDRLQLSFSTSDHAVAIAHPGMPIEATVAPYPGEVFPGEVYVVSPTLDPATRRLVLKAWVPNEDRRLRPGMFAEVALEVGHREAAISVPEAAIVFDHQGTFVWRVTGDDHAERVPIETGLRTGGIVEVTMGLHPGDTIVTAGVHKVSEGDALIAATRPPAAGGQALHRPEEREKTGEGT